jgi:hypothetical protein
VPLGAVQDGGERVIAIVDEQVRNECWNLYDSYG